MAKIPNPKEFQDLTLPEKPMRKECVPSLSKEVRTHVQNLKHIQAETNFGISNWKQELQPAKEGKPAKKMNKRLFIDWTIALSLLWIFLNWPSTSGLGGFFRLAGFPLVYARGIGGKFQEFDFSALAIDILLGMIFVVGTSWLCAWSRSKTRS